jgi:hypothetical protein
LWIVVPRRRYYHISLLAPCLTALSLSCRKGAFEMTTDNHLMWSTLKKKRLPKFEDILDAIADLPPKCEIKSDDAKTVPKKAANA